MHYRLGLHNVYPATLLRLTERETSQIPAMSGPSAGQSSYRALDEIRTRCRRWFFLRHPFVALRFGALTFLDTWHRFLG